MNYTLKLFSHKPKVQHWRDVYKRQFAMNELLKSYVSSATKHPVQLNLFTPGE